MAALQSSFAMRASSSAISFKSNVAAAPAVPVATLRVAPRSAPLVVENRVSIRFTRIGRKKSPFYRIIAVDSRVRRDGKPLEYLGWYNPMSKETNLNAPAIKKWLENGAQPSDTVGSLLRKAMIVE